MSFQKLTQISAEVLYQAITDTKNRQHYINTQRAFMCTYSNVMDHEKYQPRYFVVGYHRPVVKRTQVRSMRWLAMISWCTGHTSSDCICDLQLLVRVPAETVT